MVHEMEVKVLHEGNTYSYEITIPATLGQDTLRLVAGGVLFDNNWCPDSELDVTVTVDGKDMWF